MIGTSTSGEGEQSLVAFVADGLSAKERPHVGVRGIYLLEASRDVGNDLFETVTELEGRPLDHPWIGAETVVERLEDGSVGVKVHEPVVAVGMVLLVATGTLG